MKDKKKIQNSTEKIIRNTLPSWEYNSIEPNPCLALLFGLVNHKFQIFRQDNKIFLWNETLDLQIIFQRNLVIIRQIKRYTCFGYLMCESDK